MKVKSILILLVILLALGGYFYFFNNSEPSSEPETQVFVWGVDMLRIERIEIQLPREDKSEAFIKIGPEDEFPWYFDDPERSAVEMERWAGIPLLLGGPGADRMIAQDTTVEKLGEYGLAQPQMEIILTIDNGDILNIKVGDKTPDKDNYYVQAPNSNDVYLVDYTWYEVLEHLVNEPPYVSPSAD